MNSSQQTHSEVEDQIDIIALLSKVWAGRKFIIKSAVIAAVIGVLVAILTPNTYTASSMFTPNSSGSSPAGASGLKGLASLAGINIGSMTEREQRNFTHVVWKDFRKLHLQKRHC